MVVMYDTTTVETVPANPPAVAGYVGGLFPTFAPLVKLFPNAHHLSIAVNSGEDADCLDCEPGDATPQQVAAWVKRQQARGVKVPAVYMSVSSAMTVVGLLAQAGVPRSAVRLWTAHYTGREHLCGPQCGFGMNTTADATQWTDKALGRNLDQSVCQDSFFGIAPAPATSLHYDWFDAKRRLVSGRRLLERDVVMEYDRRRKHPLLNVFRLRILRTELGLLAGRVFTVAYEQQLNGKPSWGLFHRGWRYQVLRHRADGKRLA